MASGPRPPGEVGADAHSLIKLRERTENPQLTDVPRDLRVHGARHASRESLPPSKPCRPPKQKPKRPLRARLANWLTFIVPLPKLIRFQVAVSIRVVV